MGCIFGLHVLKLRQLHPRHVLCVAQHYYVISLLQQCVQITKEILPRSRCEYIVHNTMVYTLILYLFQTYFLVIMQLKLHVLLLKISKICDIATVNTSHIKKRKYDL